MPVEILVVEDNPGDARLVELACLEWERNCAVNIVEDGVEAMDFLRQEGQYAQKELPELILLDLNLPRKSGREVLEEVKEDAELKRIPVIVWSSSESARDIESCYDLHANCYINKPVDLDKYIGALKAVEDFWLTLVRLPPKQA